MLVSSLLTCTLAREQDMVSYLLTQPTTLVRASTGAALWRHQILLRVVGIPGMARGLEKLRVY